MNRGKPLAGPARAFIAAMATMAVCAPCVAAPAHAPGEVIVRFKDGVTHAARIDALHDRAARFERTLPRRGMQLVHSAPGRSVADTVAAFERDPRVEWAEPNYIREPAEMSNDPSLPLLWGLENTGQAVDGASGTPDADIDASAAWDVTRGDASVVVAVVDTGAILHHPDLAPSLWTNPGEVAADGIDNDANGVVDDLHGADFSAAEADGDPSDDMAVNSGSHGTHVASTIAAPGGNSVGVAGVAPNVRVMPVRFLGAKPTVADEIRAIAYARANGARIVNGSFGATTAPSVAEKEAIAAATDVLFVFAAGNGGVDAMGDSNETAAAAFYPCSYDLPNVICVAASDQNDTLAPFSNFGATRVHLAAPGTRVLGAVGVRRQLFSDGFEAGLAKWSAANPWGLTSTTFATGAASLTDTPFGNYPNQSDAVVQLSQALDLTAGQGCYARMDVRLATQPNLDALLVETSVNGVDWTVDGTFSGTTAGNFARKYVDLSHRDGAPSVLFRLRMHSDATVNDDGVWVDNVDLGCLVSPGEYTGESSEFEFRSGTSMASPHVAGVAALLRSADPSLSVVEIKARILNGVDRVPGLAGKTLTGGRLNALQAVKPDLSAQTGGAEAVTSTSAVLTGGVISRVPAVTARFEVGSTAAFEMTPPPPVVLGLGDAPQGVSATLSGLEPGRTYFYRLVAEGLARRSDGQVMTLATLPSPAVQLFGAPKAKAKPKPCVLLKGKKKATCLRRTAALKRCAKVRPARAKRVCIAKAKRVH
jgi:thermitase